MSIFDDVIFEDEPTPAKAPVPADRAHSRFAPSALKRILACPRSVELSEAVEADAGPARGSIYAAEGSVAHLIAEAYLRGEPSPAPGTIIEHDGFEVPITADMHTHGKAYAEYVRARMQKGDHLYVETTVRLDAVVGESANMYGHLDAAVWSPKRRHLLVIDYKYGRGVAVSAVENPQLKAYALGAMNTLPEIDPDEVRSIEMIVVQPRLSETPDSAGLLGEELRQWGAKTLRPVIQKIEQDGSRQSPYITGDHCRFCPARGQCPAMRERAKDAARKAFEGKPLPAATLSDEELADALDELDVIEPYFEAVRAEAERRAEKGNHIRGRKLVPGRQKREWLLDPAALEEWFRVRGYRRDEFMEPEKLVSVAKAEKFIATRDKDKFKEIWMATASGTSLVKSSDNRPPARASKPAHEVFKDAPLPQTKRRKK